MSFAQTSASPHPEGIPVLITSKGRAGNAPCLLLSASTQKPFIAEDRVLCVRDTGTRNAVYDLMVEDAEEFFASGVLVHNCRYALGGMIKSGEIPGMPKMRMNF